MKIPKLLPFPPFLAVAILAAAVFRRLNNPLPPILTQLSRTRRPLVPRRAPKHMVTRYSK